MQYMDSLGSAVPETTPGCQEDLGLSFLQQEKAKVNTQREELGGGVAGSRYRLQDSSPSGLTQDALNCLATSSDSVGNVSQGKFDRDPNARVFTGDWLHRCPLPGPYQTF